MTFSEFGAGTTDAVASTIYPSVCLSKFVSPQAMCFRTTPYKADTNSVEDIFRTSYPLQVGRRIIEFVSIFVIDFMFGGRPRLNKSVCNEKMNAKISSNIVFRHANAHVSIPCDLGCQDTPRSSSSAAADAPDARSITNLVPALISSDWGPSFFLHTGSISIGGQ